MIGCSGVLAFAIAALGTTMFLLDEPRPVGDSSAAAAALADRMDAALHRDAWERTGAVRWTFSISGTQHLWDRARSYARVRWGDTEVQVDLDDPRRGVAFEGATRLEGDAGREVIRSGWERWVNDAFWLSAPFKTRDPGTSLSIVEAEGSDALLVSYASGGATPGDAYLWLLDDDGTPRAWRMWVSVLPVGGAEATWEDWVTLSTGARLARRHAAGPVTIEMRELMGAETLAEIEPGPDPFALLDALPRE